MANEKRSSNQFKKSIQRQPYQICTVTVMDTSDPLITFDKDGVCNYVHAYRDYEKNQKLTEAVAENKLNQIIEKLRKEGRGKDYDCIMGLSGGVDSSYMCYFVTKVMGLRALVVHVDTGWNSELAVNNIQNIVQKLNLDLHTLVIDWKEMKDLQLAYFKSSIANLDVPQDHAFIASLYQEAEKYKIKYIMNGGNMATESILPLSWGYDAADERNLKAIHKKFGTIKLKTFPTVSIYRQKIWYPKIKGMEVIRPLEFIDYNKEQVKEFLKTNLAWRDYGGKHYESKFTKFFQSYYLPVKFGFDKRKAHLSSLIVSGQITREYALEELEKPLYDPRELENDKSYFAKKIGISLEEFETIMQKPPSFYYQFPNNEKRKKQISSILKAFSFLKRK
jgi:aminotransferase